MAKLVVLGSVNADHVIKVPNFPKPGETLVGTDYQVIAGGKGANQAMAAARAGADVAFIATVGDDAFGLNIKQTFSENNIKTLAVTNIKNSKTGIAMIQVNTNLGENSIVIFAGANDFLTSEYVLTQKTLISQAEFLLMQLETPLEAIETAARIAYQSGVKVVLNPAPATVLSDELLAYTYLLTPNETEAEILTGIKVCDENSANLAANYLHKKGVEIVIITLGSKGVFVSQKVVSRLHLGFKVKALDTTAAGDTFNGALLSGLIEGKNLADSINFAQAAAAISVTRFGAQNSIPKRAEIEQFMLEQAN